MTVFSCITHCSRSPAGKLPDIRLRTKHIYAGREAPGKAFRLYTEASHGALAAERTPEILRANLATVALQLKALGVDNVLQFPFMDAPPVVAIARALELLLALGALDKQVDHLLVSAQGRRTAGVVHQCCRTLQAWLA